MTSTSTIERTEITQVVTADADADPGEVAHVVYVPTELRGEYTAAALVFKARVEGTPVRALCGYTWVPAKDPEKLPICQPCKEIWDSTSHDGDKPDS